MPCRMSSAGSEVTIASAVGGTAASDTSLGRAESKEHPFAFQAPHLRVRQQGLGEPPAASKIWVRTAVPGSAFATADAPPIADHGPRELRWTGPGVSDNVPSLLSDRSGMRSTARKTWQPSHIFYKPTHTSLSYFNSCRCRPSVGANSGIGPGQCASTRSLCRDECLTTIGGQSGSDAAENSGGTGYCKAADWHRAEACPAEAAIGWQDYGSCTCGQPREDTNRGEPQSRHAS